MEFLSTAVGPAAGTLFTDNGTSRPWAGLAVAILAVITAGLLLVTWWRRREERARAAGLFLFLAGMGMLAFAVGWGRATIQPGAGYATRYTIYASPILFVTYYVWHLYGRAFSSRFVPIVIFAALCALFAPNIGQSLAQVKHHVRQARDVERDLLAGSPPSLLAERHKAFLLHDIAEAQEHLTRCMRLLHREGLSIFRQLQDPKFAEVSFPVKPLRVNDVLWHAGVAECQGNDSFLVFALKEPTYVFGIRVRLRYEKARQPIRFQTYWKHGEQEFSEEERTSVIDLTPTMGDQTVLVLVNDRIDLFRIDPSVKPCVVRIESIDLVVPEADKDRLIEQFRRRAPAGE
jgi:hypothetical protein